MSLHVVEFTAVVLLAVLTTALLRAHAALARRVELLERALARRERAAAAPAAVTSGSVASVPVPRSADLAPDGDDVIDIEGWTPEGAPATLTLDAIDAPHLLAFLSSTCTICVGFWERFRTGALAAHLDGVEVTVVPKDPAVEDVARVRELASDAPVRVVMSSVAWDDYEVPGSPYFLLVDGRPRSIVTEGTARTWDELVRMVSRARLARSG